MALEGPKLYVWRTEALAYRVIFIYRVVFIYRVTFICRVSHMFGVLRH